MRPLIFYSRSSVMRSVLIAFCFLLSPFCSFSQQSFTYTQYMNNLTPYNSAYSLISKQGNINFLGRMQWVGIDGAPTSYLFNGNLVLEKMKATTGLIVIQDKFGVENQTNMNLFFAKSVQLTHSGYFAVSVNGGLQSYKANYSQLDATDPAFRSDINENTGTIGAGIMFYDPDKFYIGASLPRLSLRNQTNHFKNTYYFSGGFLQTLGDNLTFKPAVLLSYSPNIPLIADISTTFYFGTVGIGLNYRSNNEVAAVFSYLFNNFRMGYSYQSGVTNKNIGNFNYGTHELTLGIRFGKAVNKVPL